MKRLIIVAASFGGILLFLLASATANTALFARHYPWLLGLNAVVALSLFIASAASRLAFSMTEDGLLELLSFIFASATLAWVTIFLFLSLFKRKEVTTTTLWEAVTVYILIGMTWASVYTILEIIYPGSFVDSANPSESMNFHTSMYYSFVTLATLGYGDIVPVTQEARGLVIVEVLTGVLYMAILISRLVGTWRRHTNGGDEK
ncbi:MAG TPA: ion channel [Methanomassiliicoccaceae archaeon]|nr:ion channel [Methanomassiliicoccaceae archaeon]